MQNFADQCLDMARSILSQNLKSIQKEGLIIPIGKEISQLEEPGHAALAIGEYYKATEESSINEIDLIDISVRCITQQSLFNNQPTIAYSLLALLSFGSSQERNLVWERLVDETKSKIDYLVNNEFDNNNKTIFNIAKSIVRFSMGFSKKDETGKQIDQFIENININSSNGFFDDYPYGIKGAFNLNGIMSFSFLRQSLELHSNSNLKDRKLPSLRTYAEKYLKILPEIIRKDGLSWCVGEGVGAYSQMHCISIILQGMKDEWISKLQKPLYMNILRRLFQFLFVTYLDQEHGYLVIKDQERTTISSQTTRMANFDAVRYLCQWSKLARSVGGSINSSILSTKRMSKFISFDKSHKKEQGIFIYQNHEHEINFQIPLITSNANKNSSDSLAFPHCPGVFDWPVDKYLPVLLPELTFGENVIIPSFYGKNCITGLRSKDSLYFKYEQPELITKDEKIITNLGSVKVNWTFSKNKINSEFIFKFKNPIQLDKMQYKIVLGLPHSKYKSNNSFMLGLESLRAEVIRDDFEGVWLETEIVSENSEYHSYYGNIHYIQTLIRDYPLLITPGIEYKFHISFEPDIVHIDQ